MLRKITRHVLRWLLQTPHASKRAPLGPSAHGVSDAVPAALRLRHGAGATRDGQAENYCGHGRMQRPRNNDADAVAVLETRKGPRELEPPRLPATAPWRTNMRVAQYFCR